MAACVSAKLITTEHAVYWINWSVDGKTLGGGFDLMDTIEHAYRCYETVARFMADGKRSVYLWRKSRSGKWRLVAQHHCDEQSAAYASAIDFEFNRPYPTLTTIEGEVVFDPNGRAIR